MGNLGKNCSIEEAKAKRSAVNSTCFNEENEKSMYFLGILFADGSITESNWEKSLTLEMTDRDVVENFASFLGLENFVKSRPCRNNSGNNPYRVSTSDKTIISELERRGICRNKTSYEAIPNIEESSLRWFIRGLLEGDGCICGRTVYLLLTEPLATFIENYLNSIGFPSTRRLENISADGTELFRIRLRNKNKVHLKFLEWIYADATIYMERKYNIYRSLVDTSAGCLNS